MVATMGTNAGNVSKPRTEDVVEIPFLLGANRLEALVDLSQRRGQSVGQLVRTLIERELVSVGS